MFNKIEIVVNYGDIIRSHDKKIKFFSEYGLDIKKYPISDYFKDMIYRYIISIIIIIIWGWLNIIIGIQDSNSFYGSMVFSSLVFIGTNILYYRQIAVRSTRIKKIYFKSIGKACIKRLEKDKRNLTNNKEKRRTYDFIFNDNSIELIAKENCPFVNTTLIKSYECFREIFIKDGDYYFIGFSPNKYRSLLRLLLIETKDKDGNLDMNAKEIAQFIIERCKVEVTNLD